MQGTWWMISHFLGFKVMYDYYGRAGSSLRASLDDIGRRKGEKAPVQSKEFDGQ